MKNLFALTFFTFLFSFGISKVHAQFGGPCEVYTAPLIDIWDSWDIVDVSTIPGYGFTGTGTVTLSDTLEVDSSYVVTVNIVFQFDGGHINIGGVSYDTDTMVVILYTATDPDFIVNINNVNAVYIGIGINRVCASSLEVLTICLADSAGDTTVYFESGLESVESGYTYYLVNPNISGDAGKIPNGGNVTDIDNIDGFYIINEYANANDSYIVWTYHIDSMHILKQPRICLATVDSLQHIEIKLEYTPNVGYDTVQIYRYVTLSTVFVGAIDTADLILVDTMVNALTTSYKYEAKVIGCPTSEAHQTIYLSQGTGPNGNNLQWTEYVGNEDDVIDGYTIWKFNDSLGFVYLTPVTGLNYTDLSGQPNDLYFVEATKVGGCADNPFARLDEEGGSIRSNYYSPNGVGVNEVRTIKNKMVNPSDGLHLTLYANANVYIYDMSGREVGSYMNVSNVDNTQLVNGAYVIHLENAVTRSSQILIVNQ